MPLGAEEDIWVSEGQVNGEWRLNSRRLDVIRVIKSRRM
jgi:hypothetical protein